MRYAAITDEFLKNGHQVTYITASFSHMHKTMRKAGHTPAGLQLVLLPTPPYRNNKGLKRILSHFQLSRALKGWLQKLDKSALPGLVISATPPVLSNYVLAKFCNKNKISFIIDIQDLWPEEFIKLSRAKRALKVLMTPYYSLAEQAIKLATGVTAVAQDYLDYYRDEAAGKPQKVFYLGAKTEKFIPVSTIKSPGNPAKIILIGHSQAGSYIMMAARAIQNIPSVQLTVAGLKEKAELFDKLIKKENLHSVEIIPWLDTEKIYSMLPGYDAGLILINPESKCAFPNRAFTYFAAGLPVINNIRSGELEKCIFENNLGITIETTEAQIESAIKYCLGSFTLPEHKRIREFAEKHYDRNKIYADYYNWVMNVEKKDKIKSVI